MRYPLRNKPHIAPLQGNGWELVSSNRQVRWWFPTLRELRWFARSDLRSPPIYRSSDIPNILREAAQ